MTSRDILAQNHDIHMHSKHFSDGWHTYEEVIAYGLRWLKTEPWVGLSEHSPLLENALHERYPENWASTANRIRRSSLTDEPNIQQKIDAQVSEYISEARSVQEKYQVHRDVTILIGLEVDWTLDESTVSETRLALLDYVLMAYHGRHLANPKQAGEFLERMINHPYCDVMAHPDAFLGSFNIHAIDWEKIFQQMARRGVVCEYNLATPMPQELFEIARNQSQVKFVIGSDIHDFRQLSTRRIMDAWGESKGGGFSLAYSYLKRFLERKYAGEELKQLSTLFDEPKKLRDLEDKVYNTWRRYNSKIMPFSEEENMLLTCLAEEQDDTLDRTFLEGRLRRFSSLHKDRIVSLWSKRKFLTYIHRSRSLRNMKV